MVSEREVDICVVGATGFTGRIASQFARQVNLARLAKNKPALRIGFCGRDELRLKEIAREYQAGRTDCEDQEIESSVPIVNDQALPAAELEARVFVIPDMSCAQSLDDMTKKCRVVCSYAGPFTLCGEPLIAACARNSCNYIDVTAEISWMKLMELKYAEQFKASKTKCMPCSGFDFLPNDLLMMQLKQLLSESKTLQSWGGAEAMTEVTHACSQSTPMVSGGTAYSACCMMRSFENTKDLMRFYLNPYALCLNEKSRSFFNLHLAQMLLHPANYLAPKPMSDTRECNSIEVLQSNGPPKTEPFNKGNTESALTREYCVPFCMSFLMNKYIQWSNEKQEHCFGKNLKYYGGEVRRNVVFAYFWAFMVWIGFTYCLVASKLPRNIAQYILPAGGPFVDPKSDYMFTHLKATWPQGDVQLKWRLMGCESYVFAARGSFLAAVCLADNENSLPDNYGFVPTSMGVGPRILNELVDYAGLEISSAQVRTY